jgi:hypothetical protein
MLMCREVVVNQFSQGEAVVISNGDETNRNPLILDSGPKVHSSITTECRGM